MSIDATFLTKLRSPRGLRPLRLARPDELAALNLAIVAGGLRNRAGVELRERLEAGLVCDDEAVVFRIDSGIPVLLAEEAIPIPGRSPSPAGMA